MINFYKWRKNGLLILWPFFGAVTYYLGLLTSGLLGGLISLAAFTGIGFLIGRFMLKNPFSAAFEGEGILVADISSKGVIPTFLLKIQNRILTDENGEMKTHFNRSIVQAMVPPVEEIQVPWYKRIFKKKKLSLPLPPLTETPVEEKKVKVTGIEKDADGNFTLTLTSQDYQRSRFAVDTLPIIFYNGQTGQYLTKDFLAEFEKSTTVEHSMIDLYYRLERLNRSMLDFGRYVVQVMREGGQPWFKSKALWVVLILFGLGALGYYLWPTLAQMFHGAAPSTSAAFEQASHAMPQLGRVN